MFVRHIRPHSLSPPYPPHSASPHTNPTLPHHTPHLPHSTSPYVVAGISERIQIIFKPLNDKLGNRSTNTIKYNLSHLKDKIETEDKSDIGY